MSEKEILETKKLALEIADLESEAKAAGTRRLRSWVGTLGIVVPLVLAGFTLHREAGQYVDNQRRSVEIEMQRRLELLSDKLIMRKSVPLQSQSALELGELGPLAVPTLARSLTDPNREPVVVGAIIRGLEKTLDNGAKREAVGRELVRNARDHVERMRADKDVAALEQVFKAQLRAAETLAAPLPMDSPARVLTRIWIADAAERISSGVLVIENTAAGDRMEARARCVLAVLDEIPCV